MDWMMASVFAISLDGSTPFKYKLLDTLGITETIGPIQMGLNKPIHFTDVESSTRDIVNLTTVAVVDAIVQEQIEKEG